MHRPPNFGLGSVLDVEYRATVDPSRRHSCGDADWHQRIYICAQIWDQGIYRHEINSTRDTFLNIKRVVIAQIFPLRRSFVTAFSERFFRTMRRG